MKKCDKNNKYLIMMCVSLFLALACVILALCFWNNNVTSLVLLICAGFFAIVYTVTLCLGACVLKQGKTLCELSVEIVFVATLVFALSPLALIFWIVQSVCDKIAEKHQKAN